MGAEEVLGNTEGKEGADEREGSQQEGRRP